MLYRIKRLFSVAPSVRAQSDIAERLNARLAARPEVFEATVGAGLKDDAVEWIDVELMVRAETPFEAGRIGRWAIKHELALLGVPRGCLQLQKAHGEEIPQ
jgi:hypothetical protein